MLAVTTNSFFHDKRLKFFVQTWKYFFRGFLVQFILFVLSESFSYPSKIGEVTEMSVIESRLDWISIWIGAFWIWNISWLDNRSVCPFFFPSNNQFESWKKTNLRMNRRWRKYPQPEILTFLFFPFFSPFRSQIKKGKKHMNHIYYQWLDSAERTTAEW